MPKREINPTRILYQTRHDQRERSRDQIGQNQTKQPTLVQKVSSNSRKAKLQALKKKAEAEQSLPIQQQVKIITQEHPHQVSPARIPAEKEQQLPSHQNVKIEPQGPSESEEEDHPTKNMLKPVFISKENREEAVDEKAKEEDRKKKSLKYTTKLLLREDRANAQENESDASADNDDEDDNTELPNDDDTVNEQYEYELWKIRELKRVRREQEERRKFELEQAEIERRRKMNNSQILLENKMLGSDATDNPVETKYVYMQKYYHKGAFYQGSDDPVFNRDYNLPTPMEMQDKSMLPEVLQKRVGNFGKKGQSKYKHLTAEDTTNLNPLTRPDESILAYWKTKTSGYKGNNSL